MNDFYDNANKDESQVSLKALKDISFDDICKKQVIDSLSAGNKDPDKLPFAVEMLEKLFKDELDPSYPDKIKAIETDADVRFPQYSQDTDFGRYQRKMREIYIAIEKFAILVKYIKDSIPQETVVNIKKGVDV